MCGICGVFDRSGRPIDPTLPGRMRASIGHRGPDGQGEFVDEEIGLGHLRLSIIDLAGGSQPMPNEDGRLHVVFNGEIYNYVELKHSLEAAGHRFRTHSDTEVIVHAFEEWGTSCVSRFNGMFAFAIWDRVDRVLFAARDQLGIKPFYFSSVGEKFVFASEIKALLQVPGLTARLDTAALSDLFTYRYVPSPRTLFEGVSKLSPGHAMIVSRTGTKTWRYWLTIPQHRYGVPEAELIEEYQSLLEDAVRLQLRSDVEVGLFLSSGVDSAALLAIMRAQTTGTIPTFTIGFEGGERTNEVNDAAQLARAFGAKHEYLTITPRDYQTYYERYMWDLEEPVGNESAAAFYFLSHLTAGRVKVALTGQGADEPWAGYDRYIAAKLSGHYSRLPVPLARTIAAAVRAMPGRHERLRRGTEAAGERDVLTRLVSMYSFFTNDMKRRLFKEDVWEHLQQCADPKESLRHLQASVSGLDPLSQMQFVDTRGSLPDDLLMVGDKMSMANSLELRVPYLDVRLVEFVEALAPSMKLRRFTGKYLHKKSLEKWLPRSTVWRRKKGFANPVEHWFREGMKSVVDDTLLSSDSPCREFFNQGYIGELIEADRRGKDQLRRHLYLLVSFSLWYRRFISAT